MGGNESQPMRGEPNRRRAEAGSRGCPLGWAMRMAGSPAIRAAIRTPMTSQDRYDDAMFDYSQGEMEGAMVKLKQILQEDPRHFDAQLALAMCCCRKGDLAGAIAEGHKAEALNPKEPLVHTNLSIFYVKAGDKQKAEHHGALARMASWKDALAQSPKPPSTPHSDGTI
jgi:Flp pilus assembly protein TadD